MKSQDSWATVSPAARTKQAKEQVANLIEQALRISFPAVDGPSNVTRTGMTIRVCHSHRDYAPVYTRITIVGER